MTNCKAKYTVWDVVCNREDLCKFRDIVSKFPDIVDILSKGCNFTLFAPNNSAFKNLDLNCFKKREIKNLLLYHILGKKLFSVDICNEKKINTLLHDSECECFNYVRLNHYEDIYCNEINMVNDDILLQSEL